MKALFLICSGFLFIALLEMPIGYFTFLRIIVSIGSLIIIYSEMENGFNIWVIFFGIIAILFNPIIPIYFNSKSAWMPIDLICGILFLIRTLTLKQK